MDWTVSLQNSYVEDLAPKVMVFRDGAFGEYSGQMRWGGWGLMMGSAPLWEETLENLFTVSLYPHPLRKGHVRTRWKGGRLQPKKGAFTRHPPCWHLELRLSVSWTVRNKFLLCKPPGLWYFVLAAYTDTASSKDKDSLKQANWKITLLHLQTGPLTPSE